DLAAARADLAHVLGKLLERGELWNEDAYFDDARLRRVDLSIRAVQRGRLLEVPMRFSVLTYGGGASQKSAGARKSRSKRPVQINVPRLGLSGQLYDLADLPGFADEVIRHELALQPLERLLEVAWTGDESLDLL